MNEIFLSRVARPQGELVYFVCARQKRLWSWYYVRINKLKHELFKHAAAQGKFDLADYGTVLASGYGNEPPIAVREQFEEA